MNSTATYNFAPARPAEPPVPSIRFDGDRLRVEFGPADFGSAAAYELFKRAKRLPEYEIVLDAAGLAAGITAPARFAAMLGVERPPTEVAPLPWPAHFTPEFDDQPAITQMALDAKRFAVWSDCGLGKTSVGLEWARQVSHRSLAAGGSGRVLVVTLNEIVPQWIEEARKFYGDILPVARLRSREEMRAWCAGTTEGSLDANVHRDGTDIDRRGSGRVRDPDGGQEDPGRTGIGKDPRAGRSGRRAVRRSNGPAGRSEAAAVPGGDDGTEAGHEGVGGDLGSGSAITAGAPAAVPLIAVVNYEKFNHKTEAEQVVHELRHLAGIALDESSRLKTGGGKQKWALIKSARGIEFKLSLTATPAPNELMEFASQASFLERMRSESIADAAQQIIWTYFTRCPKTHRWTIKSHARAAFFEWMASWSIYVRDPKKFGWRQTWSPPPEPEYFRHEIRLTDEQRQMVMDFNQDPKNVAEANVGSMFAGELNAIAATKLSQAAKGFVYTKVAGERVKSVHSLKPAFVADLIVSEMYAGHQVLVWTVFDEETAILQRLLLDHPKLSGKARVKGKAYRTIRDIDTLTGSTSETDRGTILTDFRAGHCRCLLTRADMLGYGMNLQFVGSMIFSGWSFSYEQFYQAIRRAYRHGQQARLRVHLPVVPELEGQMYDAIVRKQKQHEEAIAEMEGNYVKARASAHDGQPVVDEGSRSANTGPGRGGRPSRSSSAVATLRSLHEATEALRVGCASPPRLATSGSPTCLATSGHPPS